MEMQVPMVDAVMTEDGTTNSRAAIEDWFARGNRVSPLTGRTIGTTLRPNIILRDIICILSQFTQSEG
jgi:hypothetical protein